MPKKSDEEFETYFEISYAPSITGTIQQLVDTKFNPKFKPNRPIGFLADIDEHETKNKIKRKSKTSKRT